MAHFVFGSGDWIRTSDTTGMNRMLYQLSYAATVTADFIIPEE